MGKHLVLDIDATLINAKSFSEEDFNRWMSDETNKQYAGRFLVTRIIDVHDNQPKGEGVISYFVIILRPYLYEFFDFCFNYFDTVSFWSAGHFRYVRGILYTILGSQRFHRLNTIFTRKDCVFLNENGDILTKSLSTKGFNLQDTIIIDDNGTSFSANKENAIHIPAYDPQLIHQHIMKDDRHLLEIIEWIQRVDLKNCRDVRLLDKDPKKIFKSFNFPK